MQSQFYDKFTEILHSIQSIESINSIESIVAFLFVNKGSQHK